MYLDAHCHFMHLDEMEMLESIKEMEKNQIYCISVTESVEEINHVLTQPLHSTFMVPFVGIHPINPITQQPVQWNDEIRDGIERMRELVALSCVFGIGEIGLDYAPHYYTRFDEMEKVKRKEEQGKVFIAQLELAKQADLFVNIHSRQAGHYCIHACINNGIEKAVFHAFDGKVKYAIDVIKHHPSYFFSIPGSIHRDPLLQDLARKIPLENLLVESDAPALPREKNTRSKPGDVVETVKFIALLRNEKIDRVRDQIWRNSQKICGLIRNRE